MNGTRKWLGSARNSLFSPLGDQKGLSWNFAIVELILYLVIKIYILWEDTAKS